MSKAKKDVTIDDMFPKDHITGHDIGEGNAYVMVIADYEEKKVFDPRRNKTKLIWTLRFNNAKKPLILNITNATAVAEIAGSRKAADWVGRKVELYAEWVKAFGDNHLTVRIRKPEKGIEDAEIAQNGHGLSDEAQAFYDYALGEMGMSQLEADGLASDFNGDYKEALDSLLPKD